MVFKCQEDSFLKEFESLVISCEKSTIKPNNQLYDVVLENTILFPEGGGQPSDTGHLNDVPVLQVVRKGDQAIHLVDKELNVGTTVKQRINWERRFDHMQQHSGQHLLSAVLEQDYKFPTLSWWLGEQVSYVELDTPELKPDLINILEDKLNELIRKALPVTVHVFNTANKPNNCHTRGLPDDHVGDLRVITIEGVDNNLCCGTHVTNLSQLQVIKLLNCEKSTRKGKVLLNFLVGNRVLQRLQSCLQREQQLTVLLKNNPKEHPKLVDGLLKNSKIANKNLQTVLKDLAKNEADKFKSLSPAPKYYTLYRKEADASFIQTFLKEITSTDTVLVLAVGEDKGNITLNGNLLIITQLKDPICDILKAKGALKGNTFQAKADNLKDIPKVEQLLREYFTNK